MRAFSTEHRILFWSSRFSGRPKVAPEGWGRKIEREGLTAAATPRRAVSETPAIPVACSTTRWTSPTDWLQTGQTGA